MRVPAQLKCVCELLWHELRKIVDHLSVAVVPMGERRILQRLSIYESRLVLRGGALTVPRRGNMVVCGHGERESGTHRSDCETLVDHTLPGEFLVYL